jgi:hypothetical protein
LLKWHEFQDKLVAQKSRKKVQQVLGRTVWILGRPYNSNLHRNRGDRLHAFLGEFGTEIEEESSLKFLEIFSADSTIFKVTVQHLML